MPISMSHSSVDTYVRTLNALSAILDKAAEHAAAKKFDSNVYCTMRLRPDMFTFARQVQVACDQAKNASARLANVEPPKYEDHEATLPDLKARLAKTIAFIQGLDRKAIDASADRDIVFPLGPNKMKMSGADYLNQFSLPNFFFHSTAAYAILRYAGVDLAKRDFLGAVQMAPA